MPGLHLNHYISWEKFLETCYVFKDPGVRLPVCECGRILASKKEFQQKIKNKYSYLNDKLCKNPDCKYAGEKLFRRDQRKTKTLNLDLSLWFYLWECNEVKPNVISCSEKLKAAIKEFAETERKKIKNRNILKSTINVDKYCDLEKQYIEKGKLTGQWQDKYCDWVEDCHCNLFIILIEDGNINTLFSMPNEKILKVLKCCHGFWIGRNLTTLACHVMRVYLFTNLIFAAELQDKPYEWGLMAKQVEIGGELRRNNDGHTFLSECRKYLHKTVYMKDFDAMKELCKKCFRFLYILEMLGTEVCYERKITEALFYEY